MVYFSIAVVVLLLVFIVLSIRRPKNSTSADQVATVIENFLDGASGDWDWEEFIDLPLAEPELDSIRLRCATLPRDYPPGPGDGYVNPEGTEILRGIARMLRQRR